MVTKLRLVFTTTILFLSFYSFAQKDYWQQKETSKQLEAKFSASFDVKKGMNFALNEPLFKKELQEISMAKKNTKVLYFPDEKGKLIAFNVFESPVLSPELSKKYPGIKSYTGYAVKDRKSKIRFSLSHKGIQSMMVNATRGGSTFMQKKSDDSYVLYTRDPNAKKNAGFLCSTKSIVEEKLSSSTRKVDDQTFRKFRLAVSASGEYTTYHGGSVADALAAINATVTRINEVFETDLAITLELVANTDLVIYTDASTDPYSGSLSSKVQATLDSTIGGANYDVGILFNQASQGDGNAGYIGIVCIDGRKGSAYASYPAPEGDIFDLDFVAHEMGHQFGANHTWSHEAEGTQVQVEPASGTTIMGYAGITGENDVASNGDDYFHYVSIDQILRYIKTVGCAQTTSLANSPPVITPTGNFVIPKSTAFVLKGQATDVDAADILTFAWEQIDDGIVPKSVFGPNNPIGANFRSQKPSTNPERYFPSLSRVIDGQLTQTAPTRNSAWETVSDIEREMNFALTVRDNAAGGGQVVSDLVSIFVEHTAGPFEVTSQSSNVVLVSGSSETITWNVANTDISAVNTQTVDILLSTDGGGTFPVMLAENVLNDGSHDVLIPGIETTQARIMVRANGNIFFAVNTADFTINGSQNALVFEQLEYEVCKGDMLTVPFVYNTFDGFNEEATFSVQDEPAGLGVTFSQGTATSNDTDITITLANTESLAIGRYPIKVRANTATVSKEVTVFVNVYDDNFEDIVLTTPVDGFLDASEHLILRWQEDVDDSAYEIQIATDINFTNIIETGNTILNRYAPLNLVPETQYFWRVKPKNDCGEGNFSAPFTFTTVVLTCNTMASTDVPVTISSTGTPTVMAEISVFDDLPVEDVNVNIELDHGFLADVTATLTSPEGTEVVLFRNTCGELENVNATFDDDASPFICNGDPAISGMVKPIGLLSSFRGESATGVWKLTVSDNATSDGGVIKAFSLDICSEGEFRPDADNDGVFDDGPDLCLGTPAGTAVDSSGCAVLLFPASNFTVQAQSESCRDANDGAISVTAQEALNYSVTVTGNGVNSTHTFTGSSYSITDLMAGTYTMCFNATEGSSNYRTQCFDVVISEPDLLSVAARASLDGSVVDIELEGASFYTVELNGVVTQTDKANLSLSLKEGSNTLKVRTGLSCQGTYEEQFFYLTTPVVSPNPFTDAVKISFGSIVESVHVTIFSADGRMLKNAVYEVNRSEMELDLSALPVGLYFIKFETENSKGTAKVIKE